MKLELTLLLITHTAGDSLLACLRALRFQTLDRSLFEVVLVLDGCAPVELPDGLPGTPYTLRLICHESPQGRSKARNSGLHAAAGTAIVSLDGDMIAHPDLLRVYYRQQQNRPGVYIGKRIYSADCPAGEQDASEHSLLEFIARPSCKVDYRTPFLARTAFLRNACEPFWALSTCNCSYPVSAALHCGGFDETLSGWGLEDQEFGYRLWHEKLPFEYLSLAVAVHIEHERSQKRQLIEWIRNRASCVAKHGAVFSNPYKSMSHPKLSQPVSAPVDPIPVA